MLKFTVTLTFTSLFYLKVITWAPFKLGNESWYAIYPDLNLQRCSRVASGSCPGMELGVKYIRDQIENLENSC